MKTRGETFIPDPFELTPATLAWLAQKYPQVDEPETTEKFVIEAKAKGWMYANWQAGYQTVVRKGMENGWRSIVTLKKEKQSTDLAWQNLLSEARKYGFRERKEGEGMAVYRSELEYFKRAPKPAQSNVIGLSALAQKLRA